jgi:hypothetical protein
MNFFALAMLSQSLRLFGSVHVNRTMTAFFGL